MPLIPTTIISAPSSNSIVATGTRTSDLTGITATPVVVVTASPFTADGVSTYLVTFACAYFLQGSGNSITFTLYEDGADIGDFAASLHSGQPPVIGSAHTLITPTAGSHTYAVYTATSGGTGTVKAGIGGAGVYRPAFIVITK